MGTRGGIDCIAQQGVCMFWGSTSKIGMGKTSGCRLPVSVHSGALSIVSPGTFSSSLLLHHINTTGAHFNHARKQQKNVVDSYQQSQKQQPPTSANRTAHEHQPPRSNNIQNIICKREPVSQCALSSTYTTHSSCLHTSTSITALHYKLWHTILPTTIEDHLPPHLYPDAISRGPISTSAIWYLPDSI